MIDESQKAWRRKPTDKEWHEMLHADWFDRRCELCQESIRGKHKTRPWSEIRMKKKSD